MLMMGRCEELFGAWVFLGIKNILMDFILGRKITAGLFCRVHKIKSCVPDFIVVIYKLKKERWKY